VGDARPRANGEGAREPSADRTFDMATQGGCAFAASRYDLAAIKNEHVRQCQEFF
jgi:hypothetical protein